ncbi:hypothetical protein FRB91_010156 [Serendipita sp. 411]|nr:hypothetical protein FRB91_010156 [Serendipita sp. 411]
MAAPVTISTASAVGDDAGSIEVETPDQKKERAMRQIEFYLSDSNLPFDKFLWGIYDKTDAHWVPIKQMATFKRMREFEEFGHEWLVEALRRSTKLEVDVKGENVKRTDPLVERPRESVEERSVYAKLLDIPSYIINTPGETAGYLVLQRGLTDSEYSKLQKAGDFVDGGVFEWKELSEDEERPRQLEYIKNSVSRRGDDTGGSGASRSKGGRGRGRGRGAGRGGGRPGRETRNREKDTSKSTGTKSGAASAREQKSNDTKGSMDLDPTSGAKRKRDGEPDGPEAAERGGAPVSIKKVRVE